MYAIVDGFYKFLRKKIRVFNTLIPKYGAKPSFPERLVKKGRVKRTPA